MRKFVIKNKQKRKYIRKIEETPSFSFSKTAYGMMPLLVMFVAFMSTVVISTPFRDALSHSKFTFRFPEISLSNPLTSVQSFTSDLVQISFFLESFITELYNSVLQLITQTANTVVREAFVVQTNLIFLGIMIVNAITYVTQGIEHGLSYFEQQIAAIYLYTTVFINTVVHDIVDFFILIGQSITNAIITVAGIIVYSSLVIARFFAFISLTIVQLTLQIVSIIWSFLVAIVTYITTVIAHIAAAIIHTIEIPFKILYAFWLQIKPYVTIFGKHLRMTGEDLSNGFTSIGKVASLLGISK